MFLTLCETEWTVLTFLSLSLPVWSAVKVTQPYRVVSTNGTAQIRCDIIRTPHFHQIKPFFPDQEDFRVTLLKGLHGNQQLCVSILNFTGQEEKKQVQCTAQARDGAVDVTVSGLKAADTDIYRCVVQIFYPPPYLRLTGNGTLIHVVESSNCSVKEAQRQHSDDDEEEDEEEEEKMMEPVSVPVVILIILIICVLIIIIFFQTFQCEQRRTEVFRVPPIGLFHKTDAAPFPYENMV